MCIINYWTGKSTSYLPNTRAKNGYKGNHVWWEKENNKSTYTNNPHHHQNIVNLAQRYSICKYFNNTNKFPDAFALSSVDICGQAPSSVFFS